MKKIVLSVFISILCIYSFTGCQANEAPANTVNMLLDSVFYMQDSEAAYANLGMDSQGTRDFLISMAEYSFQTRFFPQETDEEQSVDSEAEIEIDPAVAELARRIPEIMQNIVKYSTKMMSLSSNTAVVKASVYTMDINSFYTDYINHFLSVPQPAEDASEEELEEYSSQDLVAWSSAMENVVTSETPSDIYVELFKSEGEWYISDMESLFYDLYYLFVGDI